MIVKVRKPAYNMNKEIIMADVPVESIVLPENCVMAIDGSTTNTGIAILRKRDGGFYYSISVKRETNETPVQYKVRLKKMVEGILLKHRVIDHVYYEEPFLGYAEAAKNLLMLRTFVEEIIVEQEPNLNYIGHTEISNMKWKKIFLDPVKVPQGTQNQKAEVRKKLEGYLPYLNTVTQDEIDAIAMGYSAILMIKLQTEGKLESKKKVTPFQYVVEFIGAETDDAMLEDFNEVVKAPQKVLENGVKLVDIPNTILFDNAVYKHMEEEDKILILKFRKDHHGNVILKHRIGQLAAQFPYIYAIVWRKNRKISKED